MGLAWSGITLACHVAIILSLLVGLFNAVAVMRKTPFDTPISRLAPLLEPVVFLLSAISVERGYYIAARLLELKGHNLWVAHPAPEGLAAIFALTAFWLAAAVLRIADVGEFNVGRIVRWQAFAILLLTTILAKVVW